MSESTVDVGQRRETFPDRDGHGEIQDISKNWITLWARRIRKSGFLPFPGENEDGDAEHQRIERRRVKHGDKGRAQGRRTGSYIGRGVSVYVGCSCTPIRNRWPPDKAVTVT